MDRRVTPPKRVTSPTWGPPPPYKQALTKASNGFYNHSTLTNMMDLIAEMVNAFPQRGNLTETPNRDTNPDLPV